MLINPPMLKKLSETKTASWNGVTLTLGETTPEGTLLLELTPDEQVEFAGLMDDMLAYMKARMS
jgi:hypothetical protein